MDWSRYVVKGGRAVVMRLNSDVTLTKVISKVWEASSKLFPEILVGYQVLYKFVP